VVKDNRQTACATQWPTNYVETKIMEIVYTHMYTLGMKYCLYIDNCTHGN
jgi:hypothetical protein